MGKKCEYKYCANHSRARARDMLYTLTDSRLLDTTFQILILGKAGKVMWWHTSSDVKIVRNFFFENFLRILFEILKNLENFPFTYSICSLTSLLYMYHMAYSYRQCEKFVSTITVPQSITLEGEAKLSKRGDGAPCLHLVPPRYHPSFVVGEGAEIVAWVRFWLYAWWHIDT